MKKIFFFLMAFISLFSCEKVEIIAQSSIAENKQLSSYVTTFLIGTRPDAGGSPISNPKNEAICRTEFNAIQPTAYPFIWTSKTTHNLTNFKAWVDWGKQQNKTIMMHQLVSWNHYYNKWLLNSNWSAKELDEMLEFHIKTVVQSVGDKVDIWNVVNESLNGWEATGIEAGKYRVDSACVWNKMGWEADASGLMGSEKINDSIPIYIRKAFEYTRKYTNAELELRDYMFEFSGPADRKLLALYQLAKHLKNKRVSVGAVGFQCHINQLKEFNIASRNFVNFRNNIKKFKDLGLKVYLTEVDISSLDKFKDTVLPVELANKQKEAYKLLMKEALLAKADGIFFWGVADEVDKGWYPFHAPLLYDKNFERKPAYYGILEALPGR